MLVFPLRDTASCCRAASLRRVTAAISVSVLGAAALWAGSPATAAGPTPARPGVPGAAMPVGAPGVSDQPLPPDAGHDLPQPGASLRGAQPDSPAAAAGPVATPPTPSGLPTAAEQLSPYLPQLSCDYREKPGVRAFADLVLRTYPNTSSAGIVRSCLTGGTSEHKEGRAWDWWASVDDPTDVAEVNALLGWLFATDADGNTFAMARRLGIMYVIWNSRIWGAYRAADGWKPYSCSGTTGCHRDHVHFSFGWAGAWAHTSYWTKQVGPVDYGPCRPSSQRNAPVYGGFNATPCPTVPMPPAPGNDLEFMQQNLNLVAVPGDSGSAVSVVQRQVGITVDGSYGTGTGAAVSAYQRANRLPVTGWVGQATWQAFVTAAQRARARRVGDYTGDGRTDPAVFRPSNNTWYVRGLAATPWGTGGDLPVPGDYTGDGRTDLAMFRPSTGVWYVRGQVGVRWGTAGDVPVPGDYSGDGRTDLAVYRPSTGVWWVRGQAPTRWGAAGDVPVPADYTGDGSTELAMFRPSTGVWYARGLPATRWGTRGDVPVPGYYDGSSRPTLAVFRPSTGTWFVRGVASTAWGVRGDVPVPGDYDGDGRTDLAVYRPATGTWWVRGVATTAWGTPGDVALTLPVAAASAVSPGG